MKGAAIVDRVAELPPLALFAAGACVFLALSLAAMAGDSCTVDEGVHLAAGHAYVAKSDYRLNPEHPPLGKLMGGIPLVAGGVRWPEDKMSWARAAQWELGFHLLYRSGNDADLALFAARAPTLLWSVLILGAVLGVARELYGPRGGLLALAAAVFCPTLLAHGHLVTSDVIVSALIFLSVLAGGKRLTEGGWKWTAYAGVLIGGALSAKFSGVLVLPMLGWLALGAWFRRRREGRPPFRARWIAEAGLAALLAWGVVWGCYGFRYAPTPDGSYELDWVGRAEKDPGRGLAVNFARRTKLLPESFLYGFGSATRSYEGRPTYALGRLSGSGVWWYFPLAVLVKTPVPVLLLAVWAVVAAVGRIRAGTSKDEALIAVAVIYGAVALASGLNIGIRHLLPAFPPLLALCGGVPLDAPRRARAVAAGALLTAAGVLLAAPGFIGYFNLPSRLAARPHELLADSNLDWGQDLGRLKAWMDRHGVPELKLAYFGSASPRHAGLRHSVMPGFAFYARYETEWPQAGPLQPGDLVAVSATVLTGAAPNGRHPALARFATQTPHASVGDSILVFRIGDP